jgi:hypothetical protein
MIDQNKVDEKIKLSQIEINTISCSFGAATSNVSRLHRQMLTNMDAFNILDRVCKFQFCFKNIINPKIIVFYSFSILIIKILIM